MEILKTETVESFIALVEVDHLENAKTVIRAINSNGGKITKRESLRFTFQVVGENNLKSIEEAVAAHEIELSNESTQGNGRVGGFIGQRFENRR